MNSSTPSSRPRRPGLYVQPLVCPRLAPPDAESISHGAKEHCDSSTVDRPGRLWIEARLESRHARSSTFVILEELRYVDCKNCVRGKKKPAEQCVRPVVSSL